MPLYRYVCENCGNEKVVIHKMDESPTIVCERCGGMMRRSVGRVGIIFKGSGFYITDSRKSSKKESGNGKKKEKSPTAVKESSKT